ERIEVTSLVIASHLRLAERECLPRGLLCLQSPGSLAARPQRTCLVQVMHGPPSSMRCRIFSSARETRVFASVCRSWARERMPRSDSHRGKRLAPRLILHARTKRHVPVVYLFKPHVRGTISGRFIGSLIRRITVDFTQQPRAWKCPPALDHGRRDP